MKKLIVGIMAMGLFMVGMAVGCSSSNNSNSGNDVMAGTDNNAPEDSSVATDKGMKNDTNITADTQKTDTTQSTDAQSDAAAGTDAGQGCQACVMSACNSELVGCENDSKCLSLLLCLENCPHTDDACHTKCIKQHPKYFGPADKVELCALKKCADNCQIHTPCTDCMVNKCYQQAVACDDNADCVALKLCVMDCQQDDQACKGKCASQHTEGAQVMQPYSKCMSNNGCTTLCQK